MKVAFHFSLRLGDGFHWANKQIIITLKCGIYFGTRALIPHFWTALTRRMGFVLLSTVHFVLHHSTDRCGIASAKKRCEENREWGQGCRKHPIAVCVHSITVIYKIECMCIVHREKSQRRIRIPHHKVNFSSICLTRRQTNNEVLILWIYATKMSLI